MKIAILINSFNLGGAEKLMYDVVETLNKKKIDAVLVSMKKQETDFEKKVFEDLERRNIKCFTISKPVGKGRLKAVLDIAHFIRKNKIDVLHTNGQSPDFFGRLATLLYPKCRVVVTVHNTGGYSKKTEQMLQGITSYYTAVSEQAKEYTSNTLGVKKEIEVIINGVDAKRYTDEADRKSGKKILSVGRVMPQKGYESIVDGVCRFLKDNPEAEWDILGDIEQDAEYVRRVKALVSEEVAERVHFRGAVTNPEKYYKDAGCFILASEFEGFGIVFIEAMLAGIPVICRKIGVIPEIEDKGGMVIELDTENISQNIEDAFKTDIIQLEKNKNICADNYSIEAVTDKYIGIYKKILRKKEG